MPNLPPHLAPYTSKVNKVKTLHLAPEIQFSGPTYQVKILDPEAREDYWTFIQLNTEFGLKDAFCSCLESEERGACWHLALSYVSLFDPKGVPLHEKFRLSFWKAIGNIWFHRYGLKPKKPGFKGVSASEEGAKLIELIKGEKIAETEENSIKFSNLSEEELKCWQEGNPSEPLLFELSGWSNFVKQIFLYSHRKQITVSFQESHGGLPGEVEISSEDFQIKSHLDEKDWENLIPTLNTISSNLAVFNKLQDGCSKITYDKSNATLSLKTIKPPEKIFESIQIGSWFYLFERGFYPVNPLFEELISSEKMGSTVNLQGEAVERFFDRYDHQISSLLKNEKWNEKPLSIQHSLSFDAVWNLKITPYFLKAGDQDSAHVARWGKWVYIPSSGFFSCINEKETNFPSKIPEEEVADFVRSEVSWLNQHPGFQVHLGSIETQILYTVDSQGSLFFERRLPHKGLASKDFGAWIYVEDEGFFNKTYAPIQLPIETGVPLRKDLIPSFIRRNRAELEQIPGFFAEDNPFQEIGIDIELDTGKRICVQPRYTLQPKFEKLPVKFYDEWVYLEGEGFAEVPLLEKLPERVREPLWIAHDDIKEFIDHELPGLQPWVRKIDPRLVPPGSLRLVLDHLEEAPLHSWKAWLHYQTERGAIPIEAFIQGFRKKEKYLFLPEGRIDLTDEHFQWIKRLRPDSISADFKLNFSTIELLRLHAFEDIIAGGDVLDLFREVVDLKRVAPFNCDELKSSLRPYQRIGAEWLFSLYNYLLGGLLCDEMGLGKTHQSMALIAALRKIKPNARFLVVCPTSVLCHWEDKINEFFPTLKMMTYHGTFRKKELESEFSLLLTSYGVLRTDIEWIKEHPFDVAFYDEVQVAKNHKSKLYQALQKVSVDVRIGLTGTPLENRLRELKALFDLVLPGYMPQESEYNRLIVRPIEKMRDMQKKSLLQRLTHPFVLRRKKIDVLRDLPEKTEAIAHCELSAQQDRLYREALLVQRQELLTDILDVKKAVPFLHVFSLLSRLKQICDHPALYYKKPDAYEKYHSGKWELFVELLKEARESGQKVVVYSQYLGMLDIIEFYLKSEGIGFASLRGSTRDRKEQISLFATDPACEVFVASLKAAGLGIDLTSASVVIHYDRWWNAARENQATDRVHRYGQSRGVQVFKLITRNTFEERIHQIIERKKDLMDDAIAFDDHEVMKAFSREELFELLQYHENT